MELLAGTPVLPNKTVFSQSMKSSASPQSVYFDKAKNVRAERFEGIVHLYRFDDITTSVAPAPEAECSTRTCC